MTSLSLGGPDALDDAIALHKSVEGVVALAHGTDETAEGVDVVLALDLAAVLVNLGDRDLDGSVVLGLDDAVGGAALAGDVAVRREKYHKLVKSAHTLSLSPTRVTASRIRIGGLGWIGLGGSVQVDDLSLVVLHFGEC